MTGFQKFVIRAILGLGFAVVATRMFYGRVDIGLPSSAWRSFWWGWPILPNICVIAKNVDIGRQLIPALRTPAPDRQSNIYGHGGAVYFIV